MPDPTSSAASPASQIQGELLTAEGQAGPAAAPKAGVCSTEFWLLGLLLAAIQAQVATGKFDALEANALCIVASLLYAALRNWLKTHHTGTLADLAAAALDARTDDNRAAIYSALGELLKTARPTPLSPTQSTPAPTPVLETMKAPASPSTAAYISRRIALVAACITGFACIALLAVPLCLTGCQTAADGTKSLTPQGKQVLTDVGNVLLQSAIAAGTNAAAQYASNGKVDGKQLAAASIDGAAYGLRTIAPGAVTDSAVQNAVVTYSGDPRLAAQLAPTVSAAVQTAVSSGVPPGTALEAAASHLNTAAAAVAATSAPATAKP